jgi:large subunit ribosomal protein L6
VKFGNMARLSSKPIQIPSDVVVRLEKSTLTVTGPGGELTRVIPEKISVVVSEDGREMSITYLKNTKEAESLLGTIYVHARNMVHGVSEGFTKVLEFEGVGYRASLEGEVLVLSLGFSHQIRYTPPEHINIQTEKNEIRVMGIDKELVGQVAATIRSYKKPEPYKGKGIHYRGERIIRKQGKKVGAGS